MFSHSPIQLNALNWFRRFYLSLASLDASSANYSYESRLYQSDMDFKTREHIVNNNFQRIDFFFIQASLFLDKRIRKVIKIFKIIWLKNSFLR